MKTSLTPVEHARVLWGTLILIPSILVGMHKRAAEQKAAAPIVEKPPKQTLRARYAESLARVDAAKAARHAAKR
jgi:hypothetical protein